MNGFVAGLHMALQCGLCRGFRTVMRAVLFAAACLFFPSKSALSTKSKYGVVPNLVRFGSMVLWILQLISLASPVEHLEQQDG